MGNQSVSTEKYDELTVNYEKYTGLPCRKSSKIIKIYNNL